jgi:hypothetical protein
MEVRLTRARQERRRANRNFSSGSANFMRGAKHQTSSPSERARNRDWRNSPAWPCRRVQGPIVQQLQPLGCQRHRCLCQSRCRSGRSQGRSASFAQPRSPPASRPLIKAAVGSLDSSRALVLRNPIVGTSFFSTGNAREIPAAVPPSGARKFVVEVRTRLSPDDPTRASNLNLIATLRSARRPHDSRHEVLSLSIRRINLLFSVARFEWFCDFFPLLTPLRPLELSNLPMSGWNQDDLPESVRSRWQCCVRRSLRARRGRSPRASKNKRQREHCTAWPFRDCPPAVRRDALTDLLAKREPNLDRARRCLWTDAATSLKISVSDLVE